jgi:predicted transcriptional regulator of viral defense system
MHEGLQTALAQRALDQYGRLTAIDLDQLDIGAAALQALEREGVLEQVARGLYRYQDSLMDAVLWPKGVRAVLSHHTALWMHKLCANEPGKIHITVPQHYLSKRVAPPRYEIYQRNLAEGEITSSTGRPVVTPFKAILDVIELDQAGDEITQAVLTAQQRNLIDAVGFAAIEKALGS